MSVGFCMCLHCIQPTPLHNSLFIPITLFAFSPVLNELFNLRHILTAEECSEVAGYKGQWIDHLVLVLAVKPVEAVEEATKVMKLYDLNTQRLHGELMGFCMCLHCIQPPPLHNSLFIPITLFAFSPVLMHIRVYTYIHGRVACCHLLSFVHKYVCVCL